MFFPPGCCRRRVVADRVATPAQEMGVAEDARSGSTRRGLMPRRIDTRPGMRVHGERGCTLSPRRHGPATGGPPNSLLAMHADSRCALAGQPSLACEQGEIQHRRPDCNLRTAESATLRPCTLRCWGFGWLACTALLTRSGGEDMRTSWSRSGRPQEKKRCMTFGRGLLVTHPRSCLTFSDCCSKMFPSLANCW